MRVKFLGTSGAEGFPAFFCECEACMRAQELGGKNIRARSSCLIDDTYMIDFNADTYMNKLRYGLDLSKLEHLLITHSHSDHFSPTEIGMRHGDFAHIDDKRALNIYGNNIVGRVYKKRVKYHDPDKTAIFHQLTPFTRYDIGDAKVTPLLAQHGRDEDCYIYIIEKDNRVLLYGNDSGYFEEPTWNEIEKYKFNGVILDCTYGDSPERDGHMGLSANFEIRNEMLKMGVADDRTKFIATHFSHRSGLMHHELEQIASSHNFIIAYDGLELMI